MQANKPLWGQPDAVSPEERLAQIEKAWAARNVTTKVRDGWLARLREKFDDRCRYCDLDFALADAEDPRQRPTIDHVQPRGKGGDDTFDNTTLACALCNTAKADMWPFDEAEFRHRRALLSGRRR